MLTRGSFLHDTVIASALSIMALRISAMDIPAHSFSLCFMNHAFSAMRAASNSRGMPCLLASVETSLMLARLTGWPPPELFVMVIIINGMRLLPNSAIAFSSFARSTLPLNGCWFVRSKASSMTQSTDEAFTLKMCPRVVSKGILNGMTSPSLTREPKTTFSAARP
ncbi:MAG: hypothetical protein BWY99_01260 [Synergistetes bacterium ADurb.BinA166]|nr:MAG: hypothetical protein BWY99_01260 [Synergistetes bacterium ADurb.BinA166]